MKDLFAYFNGKWQLERRIEALDDARLVATATGQAEFSPQDNSTLLYRETGSMEMAEKKTLDFFRHYIYRITDQMVRVYYGDGPQKEQLYQSYALENENHLCAEKQHLCGADIYDGHYLLHNDDMFTMTQTVTGPRKNEKITSIFTRKPSC